jgi:hypothetical protein
MMISKCTIYENTEMLAGMAVNIRVAENCSVSSVEIVDVLISHPCNDMAVAVVNWLHYCTLLKSELTTRGQYPIRSETQEDAIDASNDA